VLFIDGQTPSQIAVWCSHRQNAVCWNSVLVIDSIDGIYHVCWHINDHSDFMITRTLRIVFNRQYSCFYLYLLKRCSTTYSDMTQCEPDSKARLLTRSTRSRP